MSNVILSTSFRGTLWHGCTASRLLAEMLRCCKSACLYTLRETGAGKDKSKLRCSQQYAAMLPEPHCCFALIFKLFMFTYVATFPPNVQRMMAEAMPLGSRFKNWLLCFPQCPKWVLGRDALQMKHASLMDISRNELHRIDATGTH